MNTHVKQSIISLARVTPDVEVCGLIYQTLDAVAIHPCINITTDEAGAAGAFEIDPQDYIAASNLGRVIGVYHSHPTNGQAAFSEEDLASAAELALPLYLYANKDATWHYYVPESYRVPLVGLPFVWGENDCYSTVRTYYRQERGIYLTDYDRDETFENAAESAITQYIAAEGFAPTLGNNPLNKDDVLLFRTPGNAYSHHLGVFLGNSRMVHHPLHALSRTDPLDGAWLHRLAAVLRYAGKPSV